MRKLKKKEDYVLIGFACVLLGIVFGILVIMLQTKPASPAQNTISGVTPSPILQTKPLVLYDESAQGRLLDKVINREPLKTGDTVARQNIISLLPQGQTSGVIYASQNISIEYVQSADMFTAEILGVDISQAKADANIWLRSEGLSQTGICNLPLMFYLGPDAIHYLEQTHVVFSPLPNGC